MPQPRQPQSPPAAQQGSPEAVGAAQGAAVGALLGIGVTGTTAAPLAVTGALGAAAIKEATETLLESFRRIFRRTRMASSAQLYRVLRETHPEEIDDDLRSLVREELEREDEFQRRLLDRLQRDVPEALRDPDPAERRRKLGVIVDRERRIIVAREQAMAERALAGVERLSIKRRSPEGAYWSLSDRVKTHTLDCLAFSGRVWPWRVLDEIHPPTHHGCACFILAIDDAVAQGLMAADQIPEPRDAVRRAKAIVDRYHLLHAAATSEEFRVYKIALEEAAPYDPLKHPRDRHGQFIDTPNLQRKSIERAMNMLVGRPSTPMQRRRGGVGDWRRVGGRRVFVPEHRRFERSIGGRTYTSPPGSTEVYVDGEPDRGEGMDTPGLLAPVRALRDRHQDERLGRRTDGLDAGDTSLRSTPPKTWEDFTRDTHAIADELGRQYGAEIKRGDVTYSADRFDDSGLTDWDGNIEFGRDTQPTIERDAAMAAAGQRPSDADLRATYNLYRAQSHEASHTVNPATKREYTAPGGQVLEEALAEEVGHTLLGEVLRRQGRGDVLDWADDHPRDAVVRGTYRSYRHALRQTMSDLGVPRNEWGDRMFELKFGTDPSARVDKMATWGPEGTTRRDVFAMLQRNFDDSDTLPRLERSPGVASPGVSDPGRQDPGISEPELFDPDDSDAPEDDLADEVAGLAPGESVMLPLGTTVERREDGGWRVLDPMGQVFEPDKRYDETGRASARQALQWEASSEVGAQVDEAAKMWDGFQMKGKRGTVMRTVVDSDESWSRSANADGALSIEGQVQQRTSDGWKPAGYFRRVVDTDSDGKRYVKHDLLKLNDDVQGEGFATAFNKHAEAEYRKAGIDRIEVGTAWTGGYAWARAGYLFKDWRVEKEQVRRDVPEVEWQAMTSLGLHRGDRLPDSISTDIAAINEGIERDELTSESSIARVGIDHAWTATQEVAVGRDQDVTVHKGERLWAGKLYLLGATWDGYKPLKYGAVQDVDEAYDVSMDQMREQQIVAEVFDQFDGRIHVSPDDTSQDDDLEFWAEVDNRLDQAHDVR